MIYLKFLFYIVYTVYYLLVHTSPPWHLIMKRFHVSGSHHFTWSPFPTSNPTYLWVIVSFLCVWEICVYVATEYLNVSSGMNKVAIDLLDASISVKYHDTSCICMWQFLLNLSLYCSDTTGSQPVLEKLAGECCSKNRTSATKKICK